MAPPKLFFNTKTKSHLFIAGNFGSDEEAANSQERHYGQDKNWNHNGQPSPHPRLDNIFHTSLCFPDSSQKENQKNDMNEGVHANDQKKN